MSIYPDLKKEIQSTLAIPKEIIVHGRELYLKKVGDLGFDPEKVTAVEGGTFDYKYGNFMLLRCTQKFLTIRTSYDLSPKMLQFVGSMMG